MSLLQGVITYHLVTTRRNCSEILLLCNESGCTVPRTEIEPQRRIAEQLTARVEKASGVPAYCLFLPVFGTNHPETKPGCAVMEAVGQDDPAPAGTCWVSRMDAENRTVPSEARLIRESLEELGIRATDSESGPFAKPGWLIELRGWIQQQLTASGLHLSGHFRQLNASPSFSLIRFMTDGTAVWFKATGEPNLHEMRLTAALARLFPGRVPSVLAIHRKWNGWLSEEVPGASLAEATELSTWERAAKELAELQIASIEQTPELLEAGAKDLRCPRLPELIDPFLRRMKQLMAAQEKQSPAPLVDSEFSMLAECLRDSCALLESFGIADTLGHIDLNPGNVLLSKDRCVFLDWAEGCVAHPLLTFEYLRQHLSRSGIRPFAASKRLTRAYLRPWTALYPAADLARALTLAPLVAVFTYAVSSDSWRSVDHAQTPVLAAYLRSLTRRMYREAVLSAQRSEPCSI